MAEVAAKLTERAFAGARKPLSVLRGSRAIHLSRVAEEDK
jgi:hypothetical protein